MAWNEMVWNATNTNYEDWQINYNDQIFKTRHSYGDYGVYVLDEAVPCGVECEICKVKTRKGEVVIGHIIEFEGWHVTHKECMMDLIFSAPHTILEDIRNELAEGRFMGMELEGE